MQPSAGSASAPSSGAAPGAAPGPGLPHTRTRWVHWAATALALGAVVAGSAAFQPSDATATPGAASGPPSRAAATPAPDARAAAYPMQCGRAPVDVVRHASGDLDGDGRPETVAVARCHSEAGTPPSGIYVIAPAGNPAGKQGAKPRVVSTFLKPDEGMSVQRLTLRDATVSATLVGYSSQQVPRCCPDLQRDVNWRWEDGKFVLKAVPVPGSV